MMNEFDRYEHFDIKEDVSYNTYVLKQIRSIMPFNGIIDPFSKSINRVMACSNCGYSYAAVSSKTELNDLFERVYYDACGGGGFYFINRNIKRYDFSELRYNVVFTSVNSLKPPEYIAYHYAPIMERLMRNITRPSVIALTIPLKYYCVFEIMIGFQSFMNIPSIERYDYNHNRNDIHTFMWLY